MIGQNPSKGIHSAIIQRKMCPKICSPAVCRRSTKLRLLLNISIMFIAVNSFTINSRNKKEVGHELVTLCNRSKCDKYFTTARQHVTFKQRGQNICYLKGPNRDYDDDDNDNNNSVKYSVFNGNYLDQIGGYRPDNPESQWQKESDGTTYRRPPPRDAPNRDDDDNDNNNSVNHSDFNSNYLDQIGEYRPNNPESRWQKENDGNTYRSPPPRDAPNRDYDDNDNNNSGNHSDFNGNYLDQIGGYRPNNPESRWQKESDGNTNRSPPPREAPNPDRAISIVSELKANAALFAAFAFGSLNLPNTLTVSESKVTSVTTSLSVSRPLPDSDLIRTFVVLDICTLCLMISCVAASQLLIYRLTDGSYEDTDDNYGAINNLQTDNAEIYDGSTRKNSRESALGRLVTTYRNEFTVARLTFDMGLVTLLLAVGVRSLAIFDEDIVLPVAFVIGTTSVFLAVAYFTTYIEVFRTAENLTERPLFSIPFSFFSQSNDSNTKINKPDSSDDTFVSQLFLPVSLISVGLGLFLTLSSGSGSSESKLSRLGPYDVTSGATKLRVVTEKIDSEKGKNKKSADAAKKKAAEVEAKKKAEEEAAKKKAEAEAKRRIEEAEAKRKAEEEVMRIEAKKKAIAEAEAATAKAKAQVEAALENKKLKQQEVTTSTLPTDPPP